MRTLLVLITVTAGLMLAACNGAGPQDAPTTGSISGVITIGGPFNGSLELHAGLVNNATGVVAQEHNVGRIASAATGTLTGRNIAFSFDAIPFGTYKVAVYYQPAATPLFIYQSAPVTLNETNAMVANFTGQGSFTGSEPWGTISGRIALTGTWPTDKIVFVGFAPEGTQNIYQFIVQEHATVGGTGEYTTHQEDGTVVFNIAHITYGSYTVSLYSYDSVTHIPTLCGQRDVPVVVSAADANITHVNFPADFGGDPGVDPVLGSISGTVTFDGALPAYLETSQNFVSVAANTFPPQQGAPPSDMKLKPSMLSTTHTVQYELPDLPYGEYNVSVFVYNFDTHTPVYLGWYGTEANPGHVVLDATTPHVSNLDFNASVTPLQ
jgi:hypothetical protein